MKHELIEDIRRMLEEEVADRPWVQGEDLEVIMEIIDQSVARWIDNRCPGCR